MLYISLEQRVEENITIFTVPGTVTQAFSGYIFS